MKHLKQENYQISDWSGGKTIQIAIAPEGALYADRDFLWRLSSATVDLDESDFTALPDYMRWIAPIRGDMRLVHNAGAAVELMPYQPHRFDGADDTHSWGRCTDFNLMLRKGACDGEIGSVCVKAQEEKLLPPHAGAETVIVYCTEGTVSVEANGECVTLQEKEAALLEREEICTLTLKSAGGGSAMWAQTWND